MRDAAGEVADRFQLLRLDKSFPRALQLFFRLLAFGNVARDLGKADKPAVGVVDRVDDDACKKLRAVLPDS